MINSFTFKNSSDKEDMYIYENVVKDIFENRILLLIKRPVIWQYWRRTEKYSIGTMNLCISIDPNIKPLKNIYHDDNIFKYVNSNWIDIVKLAMINIYPEDLIVKMTSTDDFTKNYTFLENNPPAPPSTCAVFEFGELYPELDFVHVYNGYDKEVLVKYIPIKK